MDIKWHGLAVVKVTYKKAPGRPAIELLYRDREPTYGMELLSSVHRVACHGESPVCDAEQAIQAPHRCNASD